MEFLNMMGHQTVRLWLAQATVAFFLLGGITLLAIGMSLIVNSAQTLRFIGGMNRWVSMRCATKPLEIPRDTRQAVHRHRYWLAAIFVAGGAFATYMLLRQFHTGAVVTLLGLNFLGRDVSVWLVDSLRMLLVVGNLAAIVVGVMLAFFPDRVAALEARVGGWYSVRKMTKGADVMKVKLDGWVAVHPRAAGGVIAFCGLALIGTFGMLLPRVW